MNNLSLTLLIGRCIADCTGNKTSVTKKHKSNRKAVSTCTEGLEMSTSQTSGSKFMNEDL